MQILATTDFSTRSQRAVRRAGLLARETGADLGILHVVDDDQPEDLVSIESREARRILDEQIASITDLRGVNCSAMVIAADAYDGILRSAAAINADLIVMGVHRRDLLRDVFLGTTIERVIRVARCPVLMVNDEVERPYRKALVAVEASEVAVRAIRAVRKLDLVDDAELSLVHGYAALGKGQMTIAGLSESAIEGYAANAGLKASQELNAFLDEMASRDRPWSLHLQEGNALTVISRAVETMRPDVLAIGTHGRSAIARALLGSVTEAVLRTLRVDILAVPPAR